MTLNYLLYFQFGFGYLLVLVMGLVVYGSDFDSVTGWLYVTPLIVMTIMHRRLWSKRHTLSAGSLPRLIAAVGAIVALLVYAPLHMNYWDEHSLGQALGMAILGVCSYLMSVIAAARLNVSGQPCLGCASSALIIIGAAWLCALFYPMVVVFFLAALFIVAVFDLTALPSATVQQDLNTREDVIARYAVLILAVDIGCVIWDFQVNTGWAIYVGLSFIAAAFGYFARFLRDSERVERAVYSVAIANFTLALLWPAYLLWYVHAVVAGGCLGYLLPNAQTKQNDVEGNTGVTGFTLGWTVWLFMGLVLSNAWYANLQWAATRLVLIVPFVVFAIGYVMYRRAAHSHQL